MKNTLLLESITGEEISANLKPLDNIRGYEVRPGFYEVNGASALPGGVNFTLASHNATSCELVLFHRKSFRPFVSIPFPEHYRIGNVSVSYTHLDVYKRQTHGSSFKGVRYSEYLVVLHP